MYKLTNAHLTEEFYERIKEQYPDLSLEQVKEIVYSPWRYQVELMKDGKYTPMMHKYFGKFLVYRGRAEHFIRSNKKRLEAGLIKQETFDRHEERIDTYLKKLDEDGKN